MMESQAVEVLLVEDDDYDAHLALRALQNSRVVNHVERLEDGEKALNYLFCRGSYSNRRFDTPPALVLLDLKLPKVDGLQVLREVKNDLRTRAIPVILLSGSGEERDLVESYKIGVNSYIRKPVNFDQFQDVVKQLGLYWLRINARPPATAFAAP